MASLLLKPKFVPFDQWLQIINQYNEKEEALPTWEVLVALEYFLLAEDEDDDDDDDDGEEDKSPDLLRSICLIPSATLTAGFDLNFRQNDMWALTASSVPSWLLPPLPATSSLTASEHRPHSHLPSNFAFTSAM